MQLFKITKQGSLHFKLTDGRLGVCYESGMVRVSVKRSLPMMGKLYQINKQLKVITKSSYFYKRELISNCSNRVQHLMNFDNSNCQPKPSEYNTRYGR
jgi:hypothetical protein